MGLLAAIVLSPFGRFSAGAVVATVAVGLLLDGCNLAFGRPGPPTSGRQVPREWGKLFDLRIVALLYGARLGVGPLTILSTWTWWSFTIAAALIGPAAGALAGAVFGFVRLMVTIGVSGISALAPPDVRPEHHRRLFRRLRARRRSNWIAINGVGFAAVLAVMLAGCGGGDEPSASAPTSTTISSEHTGGSDLSTTGDQPVAEQRSKTGVGTPDPATIVTVELEDVVRTAPIDQDRAGSTAVDPERDRRPSTMTAQTGAAADRPSVASPSSAPADLAQSLLPTIAGFAPVDDSDGDRHLDLSAAADLQPDPSEEVALLETRGFKGGWTRAFLNETNDVAVLSVYQFEDAAEAEFYLEDGLITIGGYGGKFFDIEGQPGVRGFVQYFTETDDDGPEELVSLGASFQMGPRWYLVYFVGSAGTVTPEVLVPAVAAQRQAAVAV